jgi:RNA polymerase sigma-70 factor (ECF subfamily)
MSLSLTGFDVLSHLDPMRRYARTLTRDPHEAEDLVHDALVRAYERRGTFRKDGSLRAWLLSILHNVFVDRMRSETAYRERKRAASEIATNVVQPYQDHVVRLAQVGRAFFALPDEQRAALHLVAIEGLTYQEAADTLQLPVGTLVSRIGRARSALRSMEDGTIPERGLLRVVGGRNDPSA